MQNSSFDLHELFQQVMLEVRAAWRYRWHALVLAWSVMIVGSDEPVSVAYRSVTYRWDQPWNPYRRTPARSGRA